MPNTDGQYFGNLDINGDVESNNIKLNGSVLTKTGGNLVLDGQIVGGSGTYILKNQSFSALEGYNYLIDTTNSPITVTLPLAPTGFKEITLRPVKRTWETNNVTVARNGKLIENSTNDLICDISAVTVLTFNEQGGWGVYGY
jgi:hypothetical protein